MKELKLLEPTLHIDLTQHLCQNTTETHLNAFTKVVELHYENELIEIRVFFDINKLAGNKRKMFNLSYKKSAINWKHEMFELFKDKSYSISQHKLINHVEWLLNES